MRNLLVNVRAIVLWRNPDCRNGAVAIRPPHRTARPGTDYRWD